VGAIVQECSSLADFAGHREDGLLNWNRPELGKKIISKLIFDDNIDIATNFG
jgi:hypothetical protein